MSSKKRYYEILEVAETATLDDLKKAYKKAALKFHPDKGGDPEKFKEMAEAYEILIQDLKRREVYEDENSDETLKGKKGSGGATDNDGRRPRPFNRTNSDQSSASGNPSQERNRSEEDGSKSARASSASGTKNEEENGSWSAHSRSDSGTKRRGEDVIHNLKVSLEDLYLGKAKKLYVTRTVICSGCDGRGSTLAGKQVTCLGCQGSGSKFKTTISRSGSSVESSPCKDCKGTGKVTSGADRCSQCKGAKVVREKKVKEVQVEKGMQAGERIVLPGQADETPDTIPGDIVFVLCEKDHPMFRRKGDDLYVDHSVSLFEAICGFEFVLLHLDGRQVSIRSTPGRVFKFTSVSELEIDDEGMPIQATPGWKGKLRVCVNVRFPNSAPQEDLESFETMIELMTPEQIRLLARIIPSFRD